jgi:hypothetical protein
MNFVDDSDSMLPYSNTSFDMEVKVCEKKNYKRKCPSSVEYYYMFEKTKKEDMEGKKKKNPEIRIRGVSKKTKEELMNIAKNFNMTLSNFMRPKLKEIADSYSDKHKQAPTDY